MPGIQLCYSGLTMCIEVPSRADVEWLREFFSPWFAETDHVPEVHVSFRVDGALYDDVLSRGESDGSARAFMMDTRVIEYPRWRTPGGATLVLDREREMLFRSAGDAIEIIAARDDPRSRVRLMRVIRELAMDAAHAAGGRFLHASCVAVGGRAAAVTGPRSAGKTSLLLYLLGTGRCDYLTNDRLLVQSEAEALTFVGMPTIVSVRDGTLAMFKPFAAALGERRYSTCLTLAECDDPALVERVSGNRQRQGLSPAQWCAATGARAVAAARACVVLIPRHSGRADGFALRELERREALPALAEGLFGHIGPRARSDVFRYRGDRAEPVGDQAFIAGLAAGCRVYECRLGTDAYAGDACASALRALLDRG